MLICTHCSKECKSANSHRNHERCCPDNPNRNYKNGMTGKKGANQFTVAERDGLPKPKGAAAGKPGSFKGKKHTDEAKRKISQKLSINNRGGRCKWYVVSGQKVQGTWERNIAEQLDRMHIKWIKLTTNRDTFLYEMDGYTKRYTPDIYLPEYDVYLEIKGYWWGRDREKMDIVLRTYPNLNICIIEKEAYNKILQGELVW